ncbi:hypothetical protein MYCTH_2053975 [Thermothelomyces thermophilus ATCC 42464]|uniref:Uncharacterized protein n=1 Tax=Thermothelomyces thermophilus (strain ATCC 42464 / BCRC 31852 / DSM 1799) TaxID=573729 RepID=G2Q6W6_THET4|nr:uncharacterized protein MYCTH_2053975 [Thermothelomyces thermophilus ATCC 42464]AEO53944.1 hypothetical protein MYCTH_2053975 [Thermothelomyces thermophilus ATCC 42464]
MPTIFGKSGSTAGRAKARHKSIRGTISAPIPIPATPVDDEFPIRNPGSAKASLTADDEFPMRSPGTGIASPLPTTDGPGSSPDEPPEQQGEPREHKVGQRQRSREGLSSPESAAESERDEEKARAASVRGGSGGTDSPSKASPPTRRATATNPVLNNGRYSIVSDATSKHTTQSRDFPLRKKSTLRSALGRLFGRGKKKSTSGNQDDGSASGRESRPLGSLQHRSDPTALGRGNQRSPNRSASLPINEFDRPLRSHSVGPDDIMAIESARNSLHANPDSAAIRRRAATTGGHTLLRPHLFNLEWGAGLSPRPASAHGRASRAGGRAGSDDPNEIGRAITSDSGGGHRRRSRSLSGLQELVGNQHGGRRRSDEIRYWRESYDPGFMSPLSSNAQDDVDDPGVADTSAPESPATERPPKTPPQPFNFGLLSKEMIGMKITHAADMDTRLGNLESRALQLERVVDKLCQAVPGVKRSVDSKDLPLAAGSRPSLETETQSQVSAGDCPVYTSSLRPPPALKNKVQTTTSRPTSSSTLRGATSVPALNRAAANDAGTASLDDLVAKLRADLEAERAARQILEAQVKKLSDRLNTLSTTMFAMVRGPSESRSQERLASHSVGGSSPLLLTPKTTVPAPPPLPQEPLSVFESDDDDDDDDDGGKEEAELPPSKSRGKADAGEGRRGVVNSRAPREEPAPIVTYGAFGEELREDDGEDGDGDGGDAADDQKRKKAARTLSLSQLTMGKGQRTKV